MNVCCRKFVFYKNAHCGYLYGAQNSNVHYCRSPYTWHFFNDI